ncbi:hypothetical protein ACEQ6C_01505 [Rhizobium ruizarguesonis]
MTNTTEKPARGAGFNYAALDIPSELVNELEKAATDILSLGRKSTEQVFLTGALLDRAAELIPNGQFGEWVKQRCGVEPKTARNYRAIHRNLTPHKERILDLGISPTVLIHLSSASEEKLEAAFVHAEEHGRIQVDEVKALLKGENSVEPEVDAEPADIGGLDGLRALVALKAKSGVTAFLKHTTAIQKIIGNALASTDKGKRKRLVKGKLTDEVLPMARLARHELESLILFVLPDDTDPRVIHEEKLPAWMHWAAVIEVLEDLGDVEAWPSKDTLEAWLSGTVLPLLEWATTRSKLPEWPLGAREARTSTSAKVEADDDDGNLVEAPSIDPVDVLEAETGDFDDDESEVPTSDVVPLAKPGKGLRPGFLPRKVPELVVE